MSAGTTSKRSSLRNQVPRRAATSAPRPAAAGPDDALLHQKYRELIHHHLGQLGDKLFAEFTGLHFHITWAPAPARVWKARALPTGCSVCCQLSGSPLLKNCRSCGPRQLTHALRADGAGHHFTCRLGVRNYWFPIRVRDDTLGIAYLQALDHTPRRRPARKISAQATPPGPRRAGAVVMSRLEFFRAARLLQFIVQHLQTASLSDLRKADLTSAGHAVLALEKEQARLHETLQRHVPRTLQSPRLTRHFGAESHAEQIVHRLMEYIERDYAKPVTLRRCARELGMNAAYLSTLFSRAVGVPFKTYLTARRLEQAKALLGDAIKTLSEVAFAVGYTSENRFRIAFKNATGLSPKMWRETMQTTPRPDSGARPGATA